MKNTFTWSNFNKSFLLSILMSAKTPVRYRLENEKVSDERINIYMNGIASYPGEFFIRRYRSEIEDYFLSGSTNLVSICRTLQNKNYHHIIVADNDTMLNSLKKIKLTSTLLRLYQNELDKKGKVVEESSYLFFSTPKFIDLNNSDAGDVRLEDYQLTAVDSMTEFYQDNDSGVLVLPTGSGKTRTATYYLLKNMVADGYQVIWLAHRSMLLEQTADSFYKYSFLAKNGSETKDKLNLICISGEHCSIKAAEKDDDIIICGVQSLSRNIDYIPQIIRDRIIIVVDEAHHTVAASYRKIISKIKSCNPDAKLLGLTATPVRMTDKSTFQLMKLYNDKIIYSVSMSDLVKKGILAEPKFENINTDFDIKTHISIDEKKYIEKWGELSPSLVEYLANLCERNQYIVDTYLKNKEKYGKTLVFAVNAHHCISLCELFREHGVKCGYIYSREKVSEKKIEQFRNGELDVLININILTEGSDIPDIQTIFLTRPTQSDVLLMQMIGRGMRGKNYGGTETVNIVDFCDKYGEFVKWLNPEYLFGDTSDYCDKTYESKKVPLYPWEMFRDIINGISYSYSEDGNSIISLPIGWYDVIGDDGSTSVIVFENQLDGMNALMNDYTYIIENEGFSARSALQKYFRNICLMPNTKSIELIMNQIHIDKAPLELKLFEERDDVDPCIIGKTLKDKDSTVSRIDSVISDLYSKHKSIIDSIFTGENIFRQRVYDFILYDNGTPPLGGSVQEFPIDKYPFDRTPCYDIKELVNEVIDEMFGNSIVDIPTIDWTTKAVSGYFGVFYPDSNIIHINCLLNSKDVPSETVKYVIYHELLHIENRFHNKTFRELEHQYPDFTSHEHFLDYTFGKFDLESAM